MKKKTIQELLSDDESSTVGWLGPVVSSAPFITRAQKSECTHYPLALALTLNDSQRVYSSICRVALCSLFKRHIITMTKWKSAK